MFTLVAVAAAAALACAGVEGVSFIKPCTSGDRACLKQSAQAALPTVAVGIPELGVPSLDPMHIERIQASQAGLEMDFRDTTVVGFKGCTVESIKRDKAKGKLHLEIHCDVIFSGSYTLSGRLLILPVEGKGKYKIKIQKISVKITFDIADKAGADGQNHWHITGFKHSYSTLKGAEFRFQNLFNGNKVLSDGVHAFANTQWKDIMSEVGPPIVQVVVSRIVDAAEILFSKLPTSELALD